MCTVSFLPLAGGGYLLATNRDESPRRGEALPPSVSVHEGLRLLAPTDADAGGTWIAVAESGACLCILNGDRPPAVPPSDDAPSRGVLVLELMHARGPDAVHAELERRRAAGELREKAFKLLVVEPNSAGAQLAWIEWDGVSLSRHDHEQPTLAISSTFEPDSVESSRGAAFTALVEASLGAEAEALAAQQLAWHSAHREAATEGDAWSVCMHREDARSVSLTQVRVLDGAVSMSYVNGQPCGGAAPQHASFDSGL